MHAHDKCKMFKRISKKCLLSFLSKDRVTSPVQVNKFINYRCMNPSRRFPTSTGWSLMIDKTTGTALGKREVSKLNFIQHRILQKAVLITFTD